MKKLHCSRKGQVWNPYVYRKIFQGSVAALFIFSTDEAHASSQTPRKGRNGQDICIHHHSLMNNRWHRHTTHTHTHISMLTSMPFCYICYVPNYHTGRPYWIDDVPSKDQLTTKVHHVCPGVWEGHVCEEGRDQGVIDIIRSEDTLHTCAIVMEKSGLLFETVWSRAQRDRDPSKGSLRPWQSQFTSL